jgi:hypothetical protein
MIYNSVFLLLEVTSNNLCIGIIIHSKQLIKRLIDVLTFPSASDYDIKPLILAKDGYMTQVLIFG